MKPGVLSGMWMKVLPGLFLILYIPMSMAGEEGRWWPSQTSPKAFLRLGPHSEFERVTSPSGKSTEGHLSASHMLAQSLVGLAAQAVNEGILDEIPWIEVGGKGKDYNEWLGRTVERLHLEDRGTFTPWQLVERYKSKGIIKGYILYSFDYSEGDLYQDRSGINCSVNTASSLCGILKGVLIEEGQEAQAKQAGLSLLLDARNISQEECFRKWRDQFNRHMLCTQDPKVPHCRAMAIAHRAFVLYTLGDLVQEAMEWLEPLSPILGWNCGDEFSQTVIPSEYGHFQTATNWCLNLPLLSAGSEQAEIKKIHNLDPKTIDWADKRTAAAFVMSDGDNVQWLMGGFFQPEESSYWNNPGHGRFPFGWTSCLSQLVQVCPVAVDFAASTQPKDSAFIEFGGGYYYPDHFGKRRAEKDLLAQHARRVWSNMQRAGSKILCVNCRDLSSQEALQAFEIYAREMPGIWGILAIQYAPYEGGDGKIFWVSGSDGIEIPVVTAKYAIWGNANTFGPRIGTPARVAHLINASIKDSQSGDSPAGHWTVVHAWSFFKHVSGADEEAENLPQTDAVSKGGERGIAPVEWCIERLDPAMHVVTAEELVWRLRMQHDPKQTEQAIKMR